MATGRQRWPAVIRIFLDEAEVYTLKPKRDRDNSVHNQFESIESCVKLKLCSTGNHEILHSMCLSPSLSIDL